MARNTFSEVMMATLVRSAKGGSGTTTIACAMALILAKSRSVILIDLGGGDVGAALGLRSSGTGIDDWAHSDAGTDSLNSLLVPVTDNLRVLTSFGSFAGGPDRVKDLQNWIHQSAESVIIDGGARDWRQLCGGSVSTIQQVLVSRACYLSLRRSLLDGSRPDGLVVVREPGRSLTSTDLEAVFGVGIDAEIPLDPLISRSVDSGLVSGRLPRSLSRPLRPLLEKIEAHTGHLPTTSSLG